MFLEIKDINHFKQDFHSIALVMSQGWDLWALGCPEGQLIFFFEHGHLAYQIDGDDKQDRMKVIFWTLRSNW